MGTNGAINISLLTERSLTLRVTGLRSGKPEPFRMLDVSFSERGRTSPTSLPSPSMKAVTSHRTPEFYFSSLLAMFRLLLPNCFSSSSTAVSN